MRRVECALLTQTPGVAVFYNGETHTHTHTLIMRREELGSMCPIAARCVTGFPVYRKTNSSPGVICE